MVGTARCVAVTAVLVAVAACSPDMPQSPPSSTVAVSLAPRVKDPLNIDKIIADPCASLTAQQRIELRLEPGEPFETDRPTGCSHRVDGQPARVYVAVKSPGGVSLDELYRTQKSSDAMKLWEPFEIDGYPAIRYNNKVLLADRSQCFVAVGVNDSRLINVQYVYFPDPVDQAVKEDLCARAEVITRAVLATARTTR